MRQVFVRNPMSQGVAYQSQKTKKRQLYFFHDLFWAQMQFCGPRQTGKIKGKSNRGRDQQTKDPDGLFPERVIRETERENQRGPKEKTLRRRKAGRGTERRNSEDPQPEGELCPAEDDQAGNDGELNEKEGELEHPQPILHRPQKKKRCGGRPDGDGP